MDNIKIDGDINVNNRFYLEDSNSKITRPKSRDKQATKQNDNIKFEDAFKKAKKYIQINDTKLSLSYDREEHQPIIYVLDRETDEVIRRIPPEKLVEIAGDEEKLKGFFIEKGV